MRAQSGHAPSRRRFSNTVNPRRWIKRALHFHGLTVNHVKNITDVGHMRQEMLEQGDDKVIAAALAEGKSPQEIAQFYTERFLADIRVNFRWFLVAIMTIASVHRLVSPTFLDGSFLALMFARGEFFEPLFALSDGAQEAFLANKQAMAEAGRFYPGNASPTTLTAPFGNFAFVCQAFVILILLGEMAIAAAFAFFRSPWIRHGALFPFALTLGVVRSEFVFASILCLFGLGQCEPSQTGLRRAYALLAVVLAASIFFTPIELHP